MNEQTVNLDFQAYREWWKHQIIKTHWFSADEPFYSTLEKRNGQVFVRQGHYGGWIPVRFVKGCK